MTWSSTPRAKGKYFADKEDATYRIYYDGGDRCDLVQRDYMWPLPAFRGHQQPDETETLHVFLHTSLDRDIGLYSRNNG